MENLKHVEFNLDHALSTAGIDKSKVEILSSNRSSSGLHCRLKHYSTTLKCDMVIGVFLPPSVLTQDSFKAPALYWLSGLTCNDQNFLQKAGAMKLASELGLVLICPDTSPRGDNVANDAGYDLGQGAGFYVNAIEKPWSEHFHMYDYVTRELIDYCEEHLPISDQRSLSGHSMGGHGALTLAFKNPGKYRSVSAFSPICNPSQVPWGQKALQTYLGDNKESWKQHDATELVANLEERLPLLIDQGTEDEFLAEQLSTQTFADACKANNHPLDLRMQEGYDHSYFFIATFIDDHLRHHAKALGLM